MNRVIWALSLALCLSSLPATAATHPKPGATCAKQGIIKEHKGKKYTCIKKKKKLLWNKGVAIKTAAPAEKPTPTPSASPTPTSSATPSPSPTPTATQVQLPAHGSPCTKIGEKIGENIVGATFYMRCMWIGSAFTTEQAEMRKAWTTKQIVYLSSSKSNSYVIRPAENAPCYRSGDTFDVAEGVLECRWINGKKLQWIKINTVKKTFTNAKSPVSIDVCKLQNKDMTAVRSDRDSTQFVGFPLPDYNMYPGGKLYNMNRKGVNEVLIVPVDFPDFPG